MDLRIRDEAAAGRVKADEGGGDDWAAAVFQSEAPITKWVITNFYPSVRVGGLFAYGAGDPSMDAAPFEPDDALTSYLAYSHRAINESAVTSVQNYASMVPYAPALLGAIIVNIDDHDNFLHIEPEY